MEVWVPRQRPAGLHAQRSPAPVSPLVRAVALMTDDLRHSEAHLRACLGSSVPAVAEIGRYLAESGGKRLRPLLTGLGARAVGTTGDVSRLMCAGELLHLGSLLHDDVVDCADERRGRPSAHILHGNAGVILTGDVCLARSVQVAAEEGGAAAVLELSRVVAEMSEGEVLQLLHKQDLNLPLPIYFDIIERKSAALIAWCVSAGALAAGQTAAIPGLVAFGRAVGIAFQITDDVLDYVGDAAVTGKLPGRDLVERKCTLPLLFAMERDPSLADDISHLDETEENVAALVQRVVATGAPARALAVAHARVDEGIRALRDAVVASTYRDALEGLAHHLVERVR